VLLEPILLLELVLGAVFVDEPIFNEFRSNKKSLSFCSVVCGGVGFTELTDVVVLGADVGPAIFMPPGGGGSKIPVPPPPDGFALCRLEALLDPPFL